MSWATVLHVTSPSLFVGPLYGISQTKSIYFVLTGHPRTPSLIPLYVIIYLYISYILHSITLYYIILHYITLDYIILHYTMSYYIILYYNIYGTPPPPPPPPIYRPLCLHFLPQDDLDDYYCHCYYCYLFNS